MRFYSHILFCFIGFLQLLAYVSRSALSVWYCFTSAASCSDFSIAASAQFKIPDSSFPFAWKGFFISSVFENFFPHTPFQAYPQKYGKYWRSSVRFPSCSCRKHQSSRCSYPHLLWIPARSGGYSLDSHGTYPQVPDSYSRFAFSFLLISSQIFLIPFSTAVTNSYTCYLIV